MMARMNVVEKLRSGSGKAVTWCEELPARFHAWNQVVYLSRFERWQNRALWGLLLVALVYALVHHIWLVNIPASLSWGPPFGVVCYELAIAYAGAFTFYVLIVRLPLRRDRRNIYRHLGPLINQVVGNAQGLMQSLNQAAGVSPNRRNTQSNVEDTCSKIEPGTEVNMVVPTQSGSRPGTVMDAFQDRILRARNADREILGFAQYLASELIGLIAAVDSCTLFVFHDFNYSLFLNNRLANPDISAWATTLFDYLQLVDRVDKYRVENKIPIYQPTPELISGTVRRSDAVPLQWLMDDE